MNKFIVIFILLVAFLGLSSTVNSQMLETANGLDWLSNNQNQTGSWGNTATALTTEYFSTGFVLGSCNGLGQSGTPAYQNGLVWFQTQIVEDTTSLAYKIITLSTAGVDVTTDVGTFLTYRNADNGWGGYINNTSNHFHTALALQALKAVNYSDQTTINSAINYLLRSQNPDGGFGFCSSASAGCSDGDSNIYMTALVSSTLQQFPQTTSIASAVSKATAYLIANQNADGGFGAGTSTVYETALTLIALINSNTGQGSALPLQISIQNAIAYLTATQQANGSWDDDPYSTALALRALANIKPNLSVTSADITFSNPTPTVGDTITITANIRNTGPAQADNVLIQFYDGDPDTGGTLIGETTISSIPAFSSASASINWTILTASSKTIFIKIDPLNSIDELNETDNMVSKTIIAATLPDLSITPADIKFNPLTPEPGQPLLIAVTARNKGETAAENVLVEAFDGDPASGGTPVGSAMLAYIGAGDSSETYLTASLARGSHSIYVALDRAGSIKEGSYANNTAIKQLYVGGFVELSIRNTEVAITPSYPVDGDIVVVEAVVHNDGDMDVANVPVRFYLGNPVTGGPQIGNEITIPTVSARGAASVSTTWNSTCHVGNNDLYVKVDPLDYITEPEELNNTAYKTVSVAAKTGPDLTVTSADIGYTPAAPNKGDIVNITASIKNIGTLDSGSVLVEFSVYDPAVGGSVIIGSQTVAFIPKSGSAAAEIIWDTKGFAGDYDLYVNIDPYNYRPETNESNNIAHTPITVNSPIGPDLIITTVENSGITADKTTLSISGSAGLYIKNIGNRDTLAPFVVTAFEDKNNNTTFDPGIDNTLGQTTYQSNLPAGASDHITIAVSGAIASINNPVYLMIDSGNAVAETEEANNINCLPIFTACRSAALDNAVKTGASWLIAHQFNVDLQGTMKAWGSISLAYNAAAIKAYKSTGKTSQTKYAGVLNKLMQLQAADGSWDGNVSVTSKVIMALLYAGTTSDSTTISDAVTWLKNQQNSDKGWGSSKGYPSDAADTGLSLTALIKAGVSKSDVRIQNGAQWLINTQNKDGFWGRYPGGESWMYIDTYPIIGLALATSAQDSRVVAAKNWYYTQRNACPGIQVAWLKMMLELDPNNSEVRNVATGLLNLQKSDGGWLYASNHVATDFEVTADSLYVLGRLGYTGSKIDKGISWVESHINSEWEGFPEEKLLDSTTLALDALQTANIGDAANLSAISLARKAIVGAQNSDKSWANVIPAVTSSYPYTRWTGEAIYTLKNYANVSSTEQTSASGGVNMLISAQSADGGWPYISQSPPSLLYDSEGALKGLLQYGLTPSNSTISRGLSYLNSQQDQYGGFGNTEYTARAAIIYKLAGASYKTRLDSAIQWLKTNHNPDGGWGTVAGSTSGTSSTSWALIGLSYAGETGLEVAKGASWLLAVQNADGGWGAVMGLPSSYENSTSLSVWALSLARYSTAFSLDISTDRHSYCPGDIVNISTTPDNTAQDISMTGSVSLQEGGTSALTFTLTGNTFDAQYTVPPSSLPGTAAVYIQGNAAYGYGLGITSFVIKNCAQFAPDLSIEDAGMNAVSEDPGNSDSRTVYATIENLGAMDANNVLVSFYKGEPSAGNLIDSKTISNIPAYGSSAVSTTLVLSGDSIIFAVADPGNTITELNENNNMASISLTRQLPDLAVSPSDVAIVPAGLFEGQRGTLDAVIHNIGNKGASDMVVSFYDGDPLQSGALIGSVTKAYIDAGATALAEVTWDSMGQSGTNYVHVIVDPLNAIQEFNKDNNASSIAVNVMPPSKPDLLITSSDITFSNPNPKEGDPLTVNATIHNLGIRTSNFSVSLYDGDPVSGGTLVSSKNIAQLLPFGGSLLLSFDIDTIGLTGNHKFYIVIDPDNLIDEITETNNTAWNSLTIGPSGMSLGASTDKTAYIANDNVQITLTIQNSQNTHRTGTVDVKVIDLKGNVVSTVASSQPLTLPANSTASLNFSWNTDHTLSGDYNVYVQFTENGITRAKASAPFGISAVKEISSTIVPDEIFYSANQPVTITSTVTSLSPNYTFEDLTATIAVGDQLSAVSLYEETQIVPILIPGQFVELKTYWNTVINPAGDYPVTLEIKDASGAVLSTSTATLTIIASTTTGQGLTGSVTATPAFVNSGETTTLGYRLTNKGNEDFYGLVVSGLIIDPDTSEVRMALSAAGDVLMNATISGDLITQPLALHPKTYLVALQVSSPAMQQPRTLANTLLTVKDNTPPDLTVSTLSDNSWTNNPLLNVAGEVTDNIGVEQLAINDTDVEVNPDGAFSWPVVLLAGPNTLTVTATDLAGNETTDVRTINLDRSAPNIAIATPADNLKTRQPAIGVTGSVDETATVTVKIDDSGPVAAQMHGKDFSLTVMPDYGLNTIEATATDLAGNTSTAKRTVIFDDRSPSLSVIDPGQDIKTNQADMIIKGETSDLTAINVTITMDGNTYAPVVTNSRFEQPVTFTTEKTYQIYVKATDEAANESIVQRNVVYDTTPPVLTLDPVTSPTNLDSQVLTGTVEDWATVSVTCPTATVSPVTYPTATTWTVTLSNMREGNNAITLTAVDETGNPSAPVPAAIVLSTQTAIAGTGPAQLWIGLKNSDDQGTQFDVRAELYINGLLVSAGETLCITGVTRNPSYAKEVSVLFNPISSGAYAAGDILSVKVLTRIGTTPAGQKCPGPGGSHNNAVGLRLYYDSTDRPSGFGVEIAQNPMKDLFLHSTGTNYFLNNVAPAGTVQYKDSSSINFNNGNPWKEIGTWTKALQ